MHKLGIGYKMISKRLNSWMNGEEVESCITPYKHYLYNHYLNQHYCKTHHKTQTEMVREATVKPTVTLEE